MIKSISYSQDEIIGNIISLYIPEGQIDLDPTYSKGVFYRNIQTPNLIYDINPITPDCLYADCRHLPLPDNSVKSIMFDPPFLATKGPSLKSNEGNKIVNRFGAYSSEEELNLFYSDSLTEFYRVLRPGGILVFKCQDKVSNGIQRMTHIYICNEAEKVGFKILDLFVLLAKVRLTPEWQVKNQQHARKYHSYFLVFQK